MFAPAALAYPGLYRFDTGGDLLVRTTGDSLSMQIGGYVPQTMSAYDEDAFEIAGGRRSSRSSGRTRKSSARSCIAMARTCTPDGSAKPRRR